MRRVLFLLLPTVLACGAMGRMTFTPPDVTVARVAVTGLGLTGGTLDVTVQIRNPNAYELRATRGALDLTLDGTPFGTLHLLESVRVPAHGDTVARVPMTFTWSGVGAGARSMLSRGSVPYLIVGRLEADTPIGMRSVEVSGGGSVGLGDLIR